MKLRVARSVEVPTSEHITAIGRATNRVSSATPSPAQPFDDRPCQVNSDPNTAKMPELDDLDQVHRLVGERFTHVRPADPEHDRRHEHGDQPVAVGQQDRGPVGQERDAERDQRLLVRRDRRAKGVRLAISTD